jgi:hypothetical protein
MSYHAIANTTGKRTARMVSGDGLAHFAGSLLRHLGHGWVWAGLALCGVPGPAATADRTLGATSVWSWKRCCAAGGGMPEPHLNTKVH